MSAGVGTAPALALLGRPTLVRGLLLALALWVLAAAAAVWLATQAPWLGLRLVADGAQVRIAGVAGPAASALADAAGARLTGIRGAGQPLQPVVAGDLIEDPDQFDSQATVRSFHARQGALLRALQASPVQLQWEDAEGRPQETTLVPARRPVADLPGVFWLQLAVSAIALLAGVWVRRMRPGSDATAWFLAMGVCLALSSWASACYGSRELALEPAWFRPLSLANHFGAIAFGVALTALFLRFPRPLVSQRAVLLLPLIALPLYLADALQWFESLDLSRRLPMAGLLLSAITASVLQWRAGRGDPVARATLRWFAIAVLAGCSLFIGLVTLPPLFGAPVLLSQGHAFGFFLLIHIGLALGVARSRLFDLDRLAAWVLLWALTAALLLVLDAALLLLLRTGPEFSLATSALLVAAAWQPLRGWLWGKVVARQRLPEHEMLQGVLEVTLAGSAAERLARWESLLRQLFRPLRLERLAADPGHAGLDAEGLALQVPALSDVPPLRLSYPWGGRGVFHAADERTLDRLLALVRQAEHDRQAYDRGVREASLRIARDLHDDVSGRLLGVLYEPDGEAVRKTVRTVMADMRSIVGALSGRSASWDEAVAEWRSEAATRLEAAGIALEWPLADAPPLQLTPEQYRHLSSILRELLSNVLRHAQAGTVRVEARHAGGCLHFAVADDGVGLPAQPREGNGLANIARRAEAIGAQVRWLPATPGTRVELQLPVAAPEAAA